MLVIGIKRLKLIKSVEDPKSIDQYFASFKNFSRSLIKHWVILLPLK